VRQRTERRSTERRVRIDGGIVLVVCVCVCVCKSAVNIHSYSLTHSLTRSLRSLARSIVRSLLRRSSLTAGAPGSCFQEILKCDPRQRTCELWSSFAAKQRSK
jgi:hypothetical protein